MKKFMNEFKTFVLKGNVLNLAVGIVIGAAFAAIVTSFVDNILSPIIGLFVGKNFDALQATFLGVTLTYGKFVTSVINFIIMAFVVFLIVKGMNRLMALHEKPAAEEAPKTKKCPYCMTEIDLDATRCPHCTSTLTDS
ncbi:MAG: large conductance mechanosensitive channel protein MscL [Firmicutes bacterium]|nr:large conductance mechanosensitive channel protein MscL [Bacillota bacterium]